MRAMCSVLVCVSFGFCGTAQGAIALAGFVFDDDAFVDSVPEINGTVTPFDALTVEGAVIGPFLTGVAELGKSAFEGSLLLSFDDNHIVNGPGDDIVFFEEGSVSVLEHFRVALNTAGLSIGVDVSVSDTGFNNALGKRIHAGTLDLSDLGVGPGAEVNQIAITTIDSLIGGADLAAAGALNSISVPEPAALVLAQLGLIGLLASRRWRAE